MSKLIFLGLLVLSVATFTTAFPHNEERDLSDIVQGVKDMMEKVANQIHDTISKLGDKLGEYKDKISDGIKQLKDKVAELVKQGKEKIPELKEEVLQKIRELTDHIKEAQSKEGLDFLEKLKLGFARDVLRVLETVVGLIPVPSTSEKRGLSDIVDKLREELGKVVKFVETILENAGTAFGDVKEKVQKQIQELKEKIQELINAGKEKLPGLKQDVLDKLEKLINEVQTASAKQGISLPEKLMLTGAEHVLKIVKSFVSNINVEGEKEERDLSSIAETIKGFLANAQEAVHKVLDLLGGRFQDIKEKVKAKIDEVKAKIQELIQKGKEHLPVVKQEILNKIKDVQNILDDVANKNPTFVEKILVEGARKVLGMLEAAVQSINVESASEEKRDISSFIEKIKNLAASAVEAVSSLVEKIGGKLGDLQGKISEKVKEVKQKIEDLIQKGKDKAPQVKQELLDKIQELRETLQEAAKKPDLWFFQKEFLEVADGVLGKVADVISKINLE